MNVGKRKTLWLVLIASALALCTLATASSGRHEKVASDSPVAPKGGLLDDAARFAQRDYSEVFSAKGIKAYSELAGKRIITIDDFADAIRSGAVDPAKLPIDVIRRGESTLILNTRTSEDLRRAGIPRSRWNAVDRTGDSLFEELLDRQLLRNHPDNSGIPGPISQGLGL